MEGFCRGCLIHYDDPMELLQYTEKNRRLFVYATGLQVKRTDTFTFQLCKECFLNMKSACKFKKQCRTADKRIKNYLALKNKEEIIDFCSFLKNSEETFRFPLLSGNNTPAQQAKDDDNESTCTSIGNLLTNILQGEEMPDTEAQIIREVIEEEADVLDDSLDSHWLQEDMSIDTDFRLDFSFSAFSTPRSINNDHCYTPKRISEAGPYKYMPSDIEKANKTLYFTYEIHDNHVQKESCQYNEEINEIENSNNLNNDISNIEIDTSEFEIPNDCCDINKEEVINTQNFYIPQETGDSLHNNLVANLKDGYDEEEKVCTIDRNLKIALKDESTKEFSLDDLLVSPAYQNNTGASTPTITNILFGDKLELAEDSNHNVGQCIEKYENVQGDIEILDEFFKNDSKTCKETSIFNDNHAEEVINEGITSQNHVKVPSIEIFKKPATKKLSIENCYDLNNMFCNLCNKKYKTLKSLKIHCNKYHFIKIPKHKKTNQYANGKVCTFCGFIFNHRANYYRHLKVHNKQESEIGTIFKCKICQLECTSQAKLNRHLKIHSGDFQQAVKKKYLCAVCSAECSDWSNLNAHMRRHAKNFRHFCNICNKGFYWPSTLNSHMRNHTGECPFQCQQCPSKFKRRDELFRHVRTYHPSEKLECHHCGEQFNHKKGIRGHFRRSTSCKMEMTIKKKKLKPKKKPKLKPEEPEPVKTKINIMYATGRNEIIMSQLPYIDTERSN